MAKRKKAQPWDAAFQRVRAVNFPQFRYPPKPTAADLDAVEKRLNFKFPPSYRAFAAAYGLDGVLHGGLPRVLALTRPDWAGKTDWFRSVVDATHDWRTFDWTEYRYDPETIAFRQRVVVFAMDSGYHDWVFDPARITQGKRGVCEYLIYDVNRAGDITAIASSFSDWLVWIDQHYRSEDVNEGQRVDGEPEFRSVFKPDSPLANPMEYCRHSLSRKEPPLPNDVTRWFAWNNNTARDLALSIRDRGQTDAFPILADALQEAGCDNADLLDSCRTGDPDIDGAWVLQVLLGRATK